MKNIRLLLFVAVFAVLSIALAAASFTNALSGDSTLDNSTNLSEEFTGRPCSNCLKENCNSDDCLKGASCIGDCVPGNCHGADANFGCSRDSKCGGC
ncbi:MAG: hypothetical protein ACQCN5_07875 [Candidatus Bathyarchaeia archaeon]